MDPDYIVIGAGTSGCVILHRLSADPSVKVLVLEAGAPAEDDPAVATPGRWVSLIGGQYDWKYKTEPEPGLGQRRIGAPRGKAYGGSSAINAMVHIRGHRRSYDRWQALGNPGWSYADLQPLFERSERQIAVTRGRDPHAGHLAFLEAAAQQGFAADARHDFNLPEPEGVAGFFPKNIRDGQRHSAAAAFLIPALARPNVEIRSPAQATRLLIEGRRVVGVEYLQDGRLDRVRAEREVVLCGGAVASPHLLMLSGLGGADHLRAHGISVVADLPGVGRNLQDHLKLSFRWQGRTTLPGSTVTAGLFTSSSASGPPEGGPYSSPTASPATPAPDLQFIVGRGLSQVDGFITITVSHVQPQSRGEVRLRSAQATDAPIICANYLCEQADVAAFIDGARRARAFGSSPAFHGLRADEIEPGRGVTSDADLERYARQAADTIYHLSGTCRMGPASQPDSVVDAQLRVHGVDGLRVADGSIMPEIVAAPTSAACLVIAEKCAELLSIQ